MSQFLTSTLADLLLTAWKDGKPLVRVMIVLGALLMLSGMSVVGLLEADIISSPKADPIGATLAVVGALLIGIVCVYQGAVENDKRERKIQRVEQRVEQNPEETQAAWELARVKLESYMNRNLNQLRAIFWLTALVMLAGFGLIGYGVAKVYEGPENLQPSIVVATSGVLLNFIAGSFLVIHRSVMSQATEYVTVLERINAVGMSLQILDSLKDNQDLQQKTTADVINQMLSMYGSRTPTGGKKTG